MVFLHPSVIDALPIRVLEAVRFLLEIETDDGVDRRAFVPALAYLDAVRTARLGDCPHHVGTKELGCVGKEVLVDPVEDEHILGEVCDVARTAHAVHAEETARLVGMGDDVDVDVELLKPLDPLLGNSAYFGFETDRFINTGLGFGAEKGSRTVSELIKMYDSLLDGKHGTVGCPILNTRGIEACGFKADGSYQKIGNVSVYPADYFNPYEDATGRLKITENTYSIHWFAKSWMSRKSLIRSTLSKPVHRIFGTGFLKGKKK